MVEFLKLLNETHPLRLILYTILTIGILYSLAQLLGVIAVTITSLLYNKTKDENISKT